MSKLYLFVLAIKVLAKSLHIKPSTIFRGLGLSALAGCVIPRRGI
jgi:hypothetical protein